MSFMKCNKSWYVVRKIYIESQYKAKWPRYLEYNKRTAVVFKVYYACSCTHQ